MSEKEKPLHFKGKEAIEHVVEAQAQGILSAAEIHGTEIPGHIYSFADAMRETALFLTLFCLIFLKASFSFIQTLEVLSIISLAWAIWKSGRSGWLAWSRLERMHRIVEQERFEIKHHRPQEREELKDLYRAKGFEGALLEDVMDVLMADEERLLKVMVEEELCLSLGSQEHPLKQACGAALGVVLASSLCLLLYFFFDISGMMIGTIGSVSLAAGLSAYYEGNRIVPAVVWNLGVFSISCGAVYYLTSYVG